MTNLVMTKCVPNKEKNTNENTERSEERTK